MKSPKKKIWERVVPISKAGRSFDIAFWQAQGASTRFKAAWAMTLNHYKAKGLDISNLRLDKSKERILRRK